MMKALTALVMGATVAMAHAEGYQVNTFSAKQEGMGHVGVAMKLGSESQIFNPGALAFSNKTFEISGAVSAIKASATCTHQGVDYNTVSGISTPMNFSAAFRIYDNLYGGVTFYTPYGSSIDWGQSWAGAVLNQSVDLKVMTVQPTISWQVLPKLSVGAGLMISWGSVDLNKGLVAAPSLNKLIGLMNLTGQYGQLAEYSGVTPASVNLNGKSELALGVNVGALYEVSSKVNVGISFRSKQNMHVKAGTATVTYADEQARQILGATLDNLNTTNFDASMPAPYVLTFGAAYKPVDRLTLAFDAQLNGWGTYKQLDIAFANQSQFDQHLTKDYKNAWTLH
ncbi:MAG: outer membrane protein transport protein, partial [Muribaculaceae bacterium]|nr:outer membrane protein transport protein [Muribaculaceae bacterium]